jgi:hypothetical protein
VHLSAPATTNADGSLISPTPTPYTVLTAKAAVIPIAAAQKADWLASVNAAECTTVPGGKG